jgi:hypothetical protein
MYTMSVIPAKAGIQEIHNTSHMAAFAGMTKNCPRLLNSAYSLCLMGWTNSNTSSNSDTCRSGKVAAFLRAR